MASKRMINKLTQAQYEALDAWTAMRKVELDTPVIKRKKSGVIKVFCDFVSRLPEVGCTFRHELLIAPDGHIFHQRSKEL